MKNKNPNIMQKTLNIKYKAYRAFLILLPLMMLFLSSCEPEEIGAPEITQVRCTDPAKADSTFTGSVPGKLIVVQGRNFTDLLHVYLNGLDASFNPAFCSDNNILVWIPDTVPLSAITPDAPNNIRVVTKTGEASFDFRYYAAAPTITYFDFTLPATAGDNLTIVGTNFYVVQKVFYVGTGDTVYVSGYTVSELFNEISLTITTPLERPGFIGVITESGMAVREYSPNPLPYISGFSNDLPVQGDEFTINGSYFSTMEKIIFPDGTEILKANITFNEKFTAMTLTMPLSNASGDLLLITKTDTVVYPKFNDRSMVMFDFDGRGNWVWDWNKMDSAGTVAGDEPFLANGRFYRYKATVPTNTDWWDPGVWGMSVMWPAESEIPGDTPIENLALSIIVNTEMEWTQGLINIAIQNTFYQLKPWENGTVPVDKWVLYTIPLSDFESMTFTKYSDITALGTDNIVLIRFLTTNADAEFDINICLDDLRLTILQ